MSGLEPGELWRNLSADERVAFKKLFNKISVSKYGKVLRDLVTCSKEEREVFYESLTFLIDKEEELEKKIVSFVEENFLPKMKELYEKAAFWVSGTLKEQNYLFSVPVIMRAFEKKEQLLFSEKTTVSHIVANVKECFGLDQFQVEPVPYKVESTHSNDAGLVPFSPKGTPVLKQSLGFVS
ncbi:MAG: hypothetical protein PHR68_01680 [Candidatus Gracilibacteria bacterium]|nr:hypothetical protein [Candidatus Gracilibacteria bacterium]